jgi:hypothetical protein
MDTCCLGERAGQLWTVMLTPELNALPTVLNASDNKTRDGGQLEVSDPQGNPDDGEAQEHAHDQVCDGHP